MLIRFINLAQIYKKVEQCLHCIVCLFVAYYATLMWTLFCTLLVYGHNIIYSKHSIILNYVHTPEVVTN